MQHDERLESLAFDFYERYILLKTIGEFFRPPGAEYRVLDVGGDTPAFWPGFPSMAGALIPGAKVVVADVHPSSALRNYVRASGFQLPFPDCSFDLVCSLDTLEHVPSEHRPALLSELFRVTRDGLYLAFPFDSPSNRWAENIVVEFTSVVLRQPVANLLEHRQFGLPGPEAVTAFFAGTSCPFHTFGQGNTDVWLLMMLTYHSLRSAGDDFVGELNRRFNRVYAAQDWAPPAYRTACLLSRRKSAAELRDLETRLRGASPAPELNAVLSFCQLFLQLAQQGRSLVDKDRHIRNIEAQLGAVQPYRAKWDELAVRLGQVEAALLARPAPAPLPESPEAWPAERGRRMLEEAGRLRHQVEEQKQMLQSAENQEWKAELARVGSELEAAVRRQSELRQEMQAKDRAIADLSLRLTRLEAYARESLRAAQEQNDRAKAEQERSVMHLQAAVSQLTTALQRAQADLAENQRQVRGIYESRIWKTLQRLAAQALRWSSRDPGSPAAGPPPSAVLAPPVALDVSPPEAPAGSGAETAAPRGEVLLFCDYPGAAGLTPVRGLVGIHGWALAQAGIRQVEIRIEDQPPVLAEYGTVRLDVARAHPEMPAAERAGYRYLWDTSALREGTYALTVSATALDGAAAECRCRVLVDPLWTHTYHRWIELHEPGPAELERLASAAFPLQPLISIVVPVYRTPVPVLRRCLDSVLAQTYANWELCLADDGSRMPALTSLLEEYAARDPRIRFTALPANAGISAATNAALKLSRGEYFAFLDHDDELAPFALHAVVESINGSPEIDLFYSDEDKIDDQGRRYEPFFKPGWSPDLFLGCNYICHFVVARRWLLDAVGGLDEACRHGSQDYDFLLRVTEKTQKIRRIPQVLYHWRALAGSTARAGDEKPRASEEGRQVLARHLQRTAPGAQAEECQPGRYRVRYPLDTGRKVAILLLSGGNLQYLRPALEDVLSKTSYPAFEVVVVDNSKAGAVKSLVDARKTRDARLSWLDLRHQPFNFSRLYNAAVARIDAPLVLFLNDDITVINEDWLTAMVEHAQRPEVGAVGALLLFPDGRIQHAGVAMGLYENSGHLFKGLPPQPGMHFDLPFLVRNCASVTAACLLTRREVFLEVGGFDEHNLAVAFQDVDFCLKLDQRGYRVIYTPFARLYHHESVTKDEKIPNPKEVAFMQQKWAAYIADDPYYNPNLTRKDEQYNLRLE